MFAQDAQPRAVQASLRRQKIFITLKHNRQIPPFQPEPEHRIQPHTLWKTILDSSDIKLHP
jgi:hypothetical protein